MQHNSIQNTSMHGPKYSGNASQVADQENTFCKVKSVKFRVVDTSQVGVLQTAHSWANAGVVLGARLRLRVAFETINYRDEVSERRKVIVI